ncbi:hypothetical protein PGC34_26660 [Pseudomonas kribbensis]|uniref:hypothetical protein n=1 Tax=Pseudomonas TaxID=286 RepID=UPI00200D91F1|nr:MULTISPECIES: hypothetical protein [unclassified Pseudomonas]MDL5597816.1 hypothetical protein [Bacillus subtilis]
MAYLSTYKGYEIHQDLTGGYYDNNGNLVGQSVGYTYRKPGGDVIGMVQSSVEEAKNKIDGLINPPKKTDLFPR